MRVPMERGVWCGSDKEPRLHRGPHLASSINSQRCLFHWSICRSYVLTLFNSSLSHSLSISFFPTRFRVDLTACDFYIGLFSPSFFSSSFVSQWCPCSVLKWVENSYRHKLCSAVQSTSLGFYFLSEFSWFKKSKPTFIFNPQKCTDNLTITTMY